MHEEKAKPPIGEPMPTDAELEVEPEPGEEDVPDDDYLDSVAADDDDTVDNEEEDKPAP